VQPEERRAPDLEVVVGAKLTSAIYEYPDVFLQRSQVSRPTPALPGLDEEIESGVAETPP
jgi:hypothetical protein